MEKWKLIPPERIRNIPENSKSEQIEVSEIPDEWKMEPPKTHRELKEFIEVVQPSLNYAIWWEKTYGCNNWRKMHGLPMIRRI